MRKDVSFFFLLVVTMLFCHSFRYSNRLNFSLHYLFPGWVLFFSLYRIFVEFNPCLEDEIFSLEEISVATPPYALGETHLGINFILV